MRLCSCFTFLNDCPGKLSKACSYPVDHPVLLHDAVNQSTGSVDLLLGLGGELDLVAALAQLHQVVDREGAAVQRHENIRDLKLSSGNLRRHKLGPGDLRRVAGVGTVGLEDDGDKVIVIQDIVNLILRVQDGSSCVN